MMEEVNGFALFTKLNWRNLIKEGASGTYGGLGIGGEN